MSSKARDEHGDYEIPVSPFQYVANRIMHELAPGEPQPVVIYEDGDSVFFAPIASEIREKFDAMFARAVFRI